MLRSLVVVVVVVVGASGYQPYQYQGLHHHQQGATRANDQAALSYQKQILQWQNAVAQRAPQAPSLYTSPFVHRGYYGDYRQDAAPTAPDTAAPSPAALPPQPTIVAPLPPGPPDTPPPPPPPLPEVDNQLGGGETTTSQPAEGLKALCKAPRGQFPGTSCGKFVNCWDDVVVEQDCPLGLYFNEDSNFCDYPFNVACSDPPPQQPGAGGPGSEGTAGGQYPGGAEGAGGQGPSDAQDLGAPGARCPTEYGTYRSNKNCGVFYMCVGYTPFEFTCPAGLNFHKDLQVCDYPYRVQCDGVPSNQPPPPPAPETSTVPEGETTFVPQGPPAPPSEPLLPPVAPSEPTPGPEAAPEVAPPAAPAVAGPEAYYSLKKVPASLVDPGVPCRHNAVYRLNPACSSVAVCRNGVTQVLNCGPGTAFDVYQQTCVANFRARC